MSSKVFLQESAQAFSYKHLTRTLDYRPRWTSPSPQNAGSYFILYRRISKALRGLCAVCFWPLSCILRLTLLCLPTSSMSQHVNEGLLQNCVGWKTALLWKKGVFWPYSIKLACFTGFKTICWTSLVFHSYRFFIWIAIYFAKIGWFVFIATKVSSWIKITAFVKYEIIQSSVVQPRTSSVSKLQHISTGMSEVSNLLPQRVSKQSFSFSFKEPKDWKALSLLQSLK